MQREHRRPYFFFNHTYFFFFFALGSCYPMIAVYLENLGLNGGEIGILMAMGPIIAILVQPFWGMIADRYQIPKTILLLGMIAIALIALLFPMFHTFWALFILIIFLSIFQSPIIPTLDNLAINFAMKANTQYGSMRLWGAVGFAVAVFVSGLAVEKFGHYMIFYIFSFGVFLALIGAFTVPSESSQTQPAVLKEMRKLLTFPHFLLFLIGAFSVFGPISANNTYFGLYYQHIGGTIAGIGLVFLLSAGSEAPFFKLGGMIINKLGLESTLILASLISLVRWVIFSLGPSPEIVMSLFFLQGLSVGLYLTAAPQFIKKYTPKEIEMTAMAVYAAFGHGLGIMFNNLIGGWIYEHFSIYATYLFFAFITSIGSVSLIFTQKYRLALLEKE